MTANLMLAYRIFLFVLVAAAYVYCITRPEESGKRAAGARGFAPPRARWTRKGKENETGLQNE